MTYMFDTDICIYLIKRHSAAILERLERLSVGDVGISAITLAELDFGVENSAHPERNRSALEEFLAPLEIAPFGEAAAEAYGRVRRDLERVGKPIGALDTQIGAHALSMGAVLVTNNTREFSRIKGLKVENWAKSELT